MYLGLSLLLTWITIKLVIVFVTPGGDLRDHMAGNRLLGRTLFSPVSYTHLTLPTIYSV